MRPKVSVIVPIYNSEKYLEKCIKSIVEQSLKEIEIILINDGSTDNSHAICEKYKEKYPEKIMYINNKNIGCSATRNLGLKKANAEYIAFVDSDDYIEKDMYERMYSKMKNKDLDLVITGVKYKKVNGNLIKRKLPKVSLKKFEKLEEKNLIMLVVNKLFKKEIIEKRKINFLEECHYQEDLLFSFQYTIYAKKIETIREEYYNYILHGSNSVYNIEKRLDAFETYRNLYEYLNKKDMRYLLKYYYKLFDLYVIGGIYLLLSDKNYISIEDYLKYRRIFFDKIFNFKYIRLKSKIKLLFWYIISILIRKFKFKEKLLKIRRILRREI